MTDSILQITIKDKFELGYLVELPDQREGQLRVLEMKDKVLEYHLRGKEETLFGDKLDAYIIEDSNEALLLSQYSPQEIEEREKLLVKRREAREACNIGDVYQMRINKENKWQYNCVQTNGYLEASLSKKEVKLTIGQHIRVKVLGKSISGIPEIELVEERIEQS